MAGIIVLRILLSIGTLGLGALIGYLDYKKGKYVSLRQLATVGMLILTLGSILCIDFVEANNVGVKWSAFSGTQEETLDEGIVFKSPFDTVYQIPTTVQERALRPTSKKDNTLNVQTRDSQYIKVEAVVKYKINKENAFSVFQNYTNITNLNDKIIKNYTHQAIELAMLKYNAIDILGESKATVYIEATENLRVLLEAEGIELTDLTMDDLDGGPELEAAIADTAKAKQSLETAELNKTKAETEAQTKVIEAQGVADANRILSESMDANTKFKDFLSTWNGVLPVVNGGDGYMLDISKILKEE